MFQRQVVGIGAPGLQLWIAAPAGPLPIGLIDRGVDAGAHVGHVRPGDGLGGAETQEGIGPKLRHQVECRQDVGIAGAVADRQPVAVRVLIQSRGILLGIDDLQADVAAYRHGEIEHQAELGKGRRHLFIDAPVPDRVPRVRRRGGVGAAVDGGKDIEADHRRQADKAHADGADHQAGREGLAGRRDGARGAVGKVVVGADVVHVLGALGVDDATVELGQPAPVQRTLGRQAGGLHRVLDVGDGAIGTATPPGRAQLEIGGIAEVEGRGKGAEVREAPREANIEADRGDARGVGLAAEFVAFVPRVAQIRHGRPPVHLELVVPADGIDLVVRLLIAPPPLALANGAHSGVVPLDQLFQ